MENHSNPVVVEQSFNAPLASLWEAITNLNKMRKWYFDNIPDFKPIEGFETSFSVTSDTRHFQHNWKIIEVVPNQKISYEWSFDEYSGKGLVTFNVSENEGGSILTLVNTGLESFPSNIPEFKRESCENGWKFFICQNLKAFLGDKKTIENQPITSKL